MIYTLTLNPAIDYVIRLDKFLPGQTNRSSVATIQFGGKGINVSCVLSELGVENTALGFIGGFTGAALADFLRERGIYADLIQLEEGLTRINIKLKTGHKPIQETEINAAGPAIPEEALDGLMAKLDGLTEGDILVLAGSIPPSLPRDLYSRIMAKLSGRGIRFVVDAEGETLMATLPYRPFLIKPNHAELEGIVGHPLPTEEDLRSAALSLKQAGAQNVLISLGGEGAILLDENREFHRAPAAAVTTVNTVGAGDSMVAGFIAGLAGGYEYALKLGIAAGGATAASDGLGMRAAIQNLLA